MGPGLTLNTEAAVSKSLQQQQQPPPLQPPLPPPPLGRAPTTTMAPNINNPTRPIQSTTPIPVPIPIPYTSREQNQSSPRSTSPVRPTYSPITPPLNPVPDPAPRRTYTHNSHVDARAARPLPTQPIDFDSNPDVLALKSAISILQMQRKKAERDMATLSRVKNTALADPESFVRDLTTGRVGVEGERLLYSGAQDEDSNSEESESELESESNEEEEEEEAKGKQADDNNIDMSSVNPGASESQPATTAIEEKAKIKPSVKMAQPPQWAAIPKPQNIVRCPPINWAQYAVVGESLDKLHNEQVQRPAQGTPASLMPNGYFEFKGGGGRQEQYLGVAAPYAPLRDKVNRKSKGSSK
ncbi:hypothetical protein GGR50DRAFT_644137 [Xylaria sp. CBS 124048]|nr:hypothetical protein GGR50DRAFT_644137 [Xylaria sp. CBS 124048]